MKLNRVTPVLFVISALLSFSAKAELSIQITQGIDNPIPIAIVPFSWEGSGVLNEAIGDIVTADLQQVGEFRALSPSNMLAMPREEREVYYRDWSVLAQDYLLVGKVQTAPGSELIQVQY